MLHAADERFLNENQIKSIRRSGDRPRDPIATVRGFGYRFDVPAGG